MKVAYFILNSFDYDSRARLEVETICQMGHRVEIVATVGYDTESYLGCPIHRLPQWRGPTRKFRFAQYNILAAMRGFRIRADIYHAVDLDTLQAAFWARQRNAGKVVYEARELYTELEALGGREGTRGIWEKLERRLAPRADLVITINDSIAEELCRRYGIPRPVIIRNAAPLPRKIEPVNLRRLCDVPDAWKIIIYQGVLRNGQGLSYLLEIMRLLENTALVLVGNGPLESDLHRAVDLTEIGNKVKFIGRVQPDLLLNYTSGADAGVLLMEDVALNNRLALPQKVFQYLVAGIPQIVSPMPELAKFVENEQTGIVIPPGDAGAAAAAISAFLQDIHRLEIMKSACCDAAQRHNWGRESEILRDAYRRLETPT